MAKRGRPRGVNINPAAIEDLLRHQAITKQELCDEVGITPTHLADMLRRHKGVRPEVVTEMARVLDVDPVTLAPALGERFVYVRPGDVEAVA